VEVLRVNPLFAQSLRCIRLISSEFSARSPSAPLPAHELALMDWSRALFIRATIRKIRSFPRGFFTTDFTDFTDGKWILLIREIREIRG
jgi:hypothetical protein